MIDVSWPPAQAAYLALVGASLAAFILTLAWGMFHTRSKGPDKT
jgi:hypothetical protein